MQHKIQGLNPNRIVTILLFFVSVSLCHGVTATKALYDPRTVENNKAGVHILSPDEIGSAAKLVNSNGGDWGYVTVPIQPTDRDKTKWQEFMHQARDKHLIPIIRITTIPQGGTWATGHDTDLVDFANFLGELDWPIENRYIILFNEVNRSTEWGGTVDPEKYASIVKNAFSIFKERSPDFFLLGPSLDTALPNSSTSLSAQSYLSRMALADPHIWSYFDGWSSHSYPNPGFVASAKKTGLQSIVGYKSELSYLKLAPKPVFITETGWDQTKLKSDIIANNWSTAWDLWQNDSNVVAVTPFILQGGEQFAPFSLIKSDGEYSISGAAIFNLHKTAGSPRMVTTEVAVKQGTPAQTPSWVMPFFKQSRSLLKLENIFRVVLGLPTKSSVTINEHTLMVETAQTPKQWEKGLSARESLSGSDGMLFVFPNYHVPVFWMKDMHFPIDIIWLNDGVVVDITRSAPLPSSDKLPTYSPRAPINMVLEVEAGWTEANNINIGDQLVVSD